MSPAERIRDDAEEIVSSEDVAHDFVDVPATVVCALCGDPDCSGCTEDRSRSGVISIVAWERPGPALSRLWWTAKAASLNAEAFFESLPDGPVTPALSFAILAELCASASMLAMLAGTIAVALLALGLFPDGASLSFACRAALLAVVGLAALLVGAHATHGYSLDVGARRTAHGSSPQAGSLAKPLTQWNARAAFWFVRRRLGSRARADRVLRSPLQRGPRAAFGIANVARRLPTRSSVAFLRGAYHIDEERAKPALATSYVGAAVATIACAFVIVAAVIAALIH